MASLPTENPARKLPENIRQRGKNYYFRSRENGKQKDTPLGKDLSVAKRIAKMLAARQVAIKAGTADPREAAWAEAERKPLVEHVHDWHAYLVSKGNVPRHTDQTRVRVLKLIESAKVLRISGLSISAVQSALADLRQIKGRRARKQMSDSSVGYYARSIKSFSRWLWRDGRVREDPLVHMTLPEVNDKFVRRALGAGRGRGADRDHSHPPPPRRLAGADRSVVYAVAIGTGAPPCRADVSDPRVLRPRVRSAHNHLPRGAHEERERGRPADPLRAGGAAPPMACREGPRWRRYSRSITAMRHRRYGRTSRRLASIPRTPATSIASAIPTSRS